MFIARVFVFASLIVGAPAAHGAGLSVMCRHCDAVHSPSECTVFERCTELCMTNVYELNGVRTFHYSCKTQHECDAAVLIGKRAPPHHVDRGNLLCTECCHSTNCDAHTCENFNPLFHPHAPHTTLRPHTPITHHETVHTTHVPTTHVPITHAPIEHTTHAQTTTIIPVVTESTTIVHVATPEVVVVTVTQALELATTDACVDHGDATLTCADIQKYGLCDPNSGAEGYSFAHLRCPLTCGFCVKT